MRSLRFSEFGPPSVLKIEEVAIPEPGTGEALVQVKAAAINPSDIGDVAGRFKSTTLPRTPGRDFAGIVVKGKQPEGAEVWGSCPELGVIRDGSHAEYVVVPAEMLSLKPESLSMAQAAAIGVPYITAWASLMNTAQIQPGETILIVGAAGAVGQAGTQIANWKQARVIGADMRSDPIPGTESVINTKTEEKEWMPYLTPWGAHCSSRLCDRSGMEAGRLLSQAREIRVSASTWSTFITIAPVCFEIVPFDKAVDAYSRVAARQTKTKQVLSFV
jgi:NADPH:quinone reductase-like Zn-dependent oxidoreductase